MKTPKPFRKPIDGAKFDRRVRKRIYLEPDRRFLDEITEKDESGMVSLARELEPAENKRLKKLVKLARKNRGAVRRGKIILLAVVAGAIVVFSLAFRDRLAERTAETLLETIFGARSDLAGVSFRPFRGTLGFDSLSNSRRPFTNAQPDGNGPGQPLGASVAAIHRSRRYR